MMNSTLAKPMSISAFKNFIECEAEGLAMWEQRYVREDTTALQLGRFMDAWSNGNLPEFCEANKDLIYKKNGVPYADYEKALKSIARVSKDKFFMSFLEGEHQKELAGKIGDIDWHGYADVITDDAIVDVKYMRSMDRIYGQDLVSHWKYDWQLSVYRELAYQMDGKMRDCYLAIITKEEPCDYAIVRVEPSKLATAIDDIKRLQPKVVALINHEIDAQECGVCDYCKETKVLTEVIDSDLLGYNNYERKEIENKW